MLTTAQRRVLKIAAEGKVTRTYRSDGNVLKGPPGENFGRTLWDLDRAGLIEDERMKGYRTCFRQVITAAGRAALEQP
jgi:hypothetical protein